LYFAARFARKFAVVFAKVTKQVFACLLQKINNKNQQALNGMLKNAVTCVMQVKPNCNLPDLRIKKPYGAEHLTGF
jgi:hypothetical protein